MTDISSGPGVIENAYGLCITVDDAMRQMVENVRVSNAKNKIEVLIIVNGRQHPMTLDEFVQRLTEPKS